jgi:hypothetical protein
MNERNHKSGFALPALHVATLWNLALAARLYDVVGRQPMFFVSRRSSAADLVLLGVVVSFLLPGLVVALGWLLGRISPRARSGYWTLCVGLCAAAVALPPLKQLPLPHGALVVLAACAVGAAAAWAYWRWGAFRSCVTLLWPAIVILPGLLWFYYPASAILWAGRPGPAEARVARPATVVFVVFDEFCGMTLLDESGGIDRARYPHLAALAEEATWFRNATTTSPGTHQAMVALLTGCRPRADAAQIAAEYPRNLFTLLSGSHEIRAFEPETHLCPPGLGAMPPPERFARRFSGLLLDATVLELHILLPADWPVALPDLTGRWSDFLGRRRADSTRDRAAAFEAFLDGIVPGERPALHFIHSMFPHVPWDHLPSGKRYALPVERRQFDQPRVAHEVIGLLRHSEIWDDDPLCVVQAQQRYLLQAQYTDRLVGRLVARLKAAGLYDDCLLVIAADHGVAFTPGGPRRELLESNAPEILSIPVFVKAPDQTAGATSDRNVQSVDLLPTVVEALGIDAAWRFDGASVFGPPESAPPEKTVFPDEESDEPWMLPGDFPARFEAAEAMLARFGSGGEPLGLYRAGPHPELVGRRVEHLDVSQYAGPAVTLLGDGGWKDYDPAGRTSPSYLGGRIDSPIDPTAEPPALAVAVEGTIWAVTRPFQVDGFRTNFAALVPPEVFRPGYNRVEVFRVRSDAEEIVLEPAAVVTQ